MKTLIVVNNLSPGLNLMSKKILRILTKLSDFWRKFPQISILWSYQNILRKILRNLSSQLHQNILSENFSDFLKKLGVQHFQNFVRKFLRTQIFVDRIMPWCKFLKCLFSSLRKTDPTSNCPSRRALRWTGRSSSRIRWHPISSRVRASQRTQTFASLRHAWSCSGSFESSQIAGQKC